jgi:hypothetical protein
MKTRMLLLVSTALAFGSCSTYKSGQTPDDVYFSPGVEQAGYVSTDNRNREVEENGYVDMDSRYLRMKSSSRRWSSFDDDFMYWNNPTWNTQFMVNSFNSPWGWNSGWNMGIGYGNPWMFSSPLGWNNMGIWGRPYWNNPFCPSFYGNPIVVVAPKPYMTNPRANGPRTYNLNAYNPNNGRPVYSDPKLVKAIYYNANSSSNRTGVRVFNTPANSGQGYSRNTRYTSDGYQGQTTRPRGGYNSNDNSGTRTSSPSRTFERSNNNNSNFGGSSPSRSSGGSSGGSSGSAPTRSFGRGGGN